MKAIPSYAFFYLFDKAIYMCIESCPDDKGHLKTLICDSMTLLKCFKEEGYKLGYIFLRGGEEINWIVKKMFKN